MPTSFHEGADTDLVFGDKESAGDIVAGEVFGFGEVYYVAKLVVRWEGEHGIIIAGEADSGDEFFHERSNG